MITALRVVVALLCCVGFSAARHMYEKSIRAERGDLDEPSIVEAPHARLFFGRPNSLIGCLYFPLLLIGVLLYALLESHGADSGLAVRWFVLVALAGATGTSIFLAYSLVLITKRECPFCWTSHLVNFLLFLTVPWTMF